MLPRPAQLLTEFAPSTANVIRGVDGAVQTMFTMAQRRQIGIPDITT